MPSSKRNQLDSSFTDTNLPYNELTEEYDEYESDESEEATGNNENSPVEPENEKVPYFLQMNLSLLGSFIYVFIICNYIVKAERQSPKPFLELCEDVMPINDYYMLKEDANYIRDEIKSINIIIKHGLSDEDPTTLQKKLKKYTDKLAELNATLTYQKEQRYLCYKENVQKYVNDNPKHFFISATLLYFVTVLISCYYGIKVMSNNPSQKRKFAVGGVAAVSLTMFSINFLIFTIPIMSENVENRLFKKFPMS